MKNRIIFLLSSFLFYFPSLNFSLTLSGEEIARLAEEYIRGKLPEGEWLVKALNQLPKVSIPDSSYGIEIELPRGINYGDATFAWIKIKPESGKERRVPINLKVRQLTYGFVATRRIGKYEILKEEDVHLELCAMEHNPLQNVLGLRARKVIPRGEVITKDMVESVPLVEKNEKVCVLLERKGVSITREGIPETDGWLNDIITVKVGSAASQKELKSIVVGKNFVRVEE